MIILGLDPGLGTTGWGIIAKEGNRLSHIDNGEISTDAKLPLANRLIAIDEKLRAILDHFKPDCAAVEEVFVNKNPQSTLKLGQARGVAGQEIGGRYRQGRQGPDRRHASHTDARPETGGRGCRRCARGGGHPRASYPGLSTI